jgi:flagellar biosynthesis/type III secretory pathway protein FliH
MTQEQLKHSLGEIPQVYDSTFKHWVSQQASAILPLLLPGAVYEATLDVELIQPTRRVDKIFKILYDGEEQILHLEFETQYDNHLKSRLLIYNAGFYHKYHLPVITIVVYPFQTTMAEPPLCIREILTFHFQTLPLFHLDAQEIVRKQQSCMYPLIPTMQHVHADLVAQVMYELAELYRDDEVTLAEQFICLQLLLERTGTVPHVEKVKIKERLSMFDQLWEESPMIQKMREQYRMQYRQEGLQEGLQEGRLEGLQQGLQLGRLEGLQTLLVKSIQNKYPDLADFAQQQAKRLDKADTLELLIQQVISASNADAVRWLLEKI